MSAWINSLTAYIGLHPHWAGLIVFLSAAAEAVVMIGYFVPGGAILVAVGGIVGLGHLPLWPILIWATAGAILGDGASYWLGHTYKEELRVRWPFSRYPELIDRGEVFLQRHGAKSVFLGRFLPVLKPIVPTVAGILGMPPGRFYVANVLSAIIWSPAHVLPGMLLGASLGLMHGISARLVIVILVAMVLVVLLLWSVKLAVVWFAPLAARLHRYVYQWASRQQGSTIHRVASWFDPDHPGTPALLLMFVILISSTLLFVGTLQGVLSGDPLIEADRAINHFAQGLRNPLTDPLMVTITALGDATVIVPLVLTVLLWLVVAKAWRLAIVTGLALGAAVAMVGGLKAFIQIPRPQAMYSGVDSLAFPSGHATMATVLFGLVAWLVAGGLGFRWRIVAYAISFGWVIAIAVSRIYLGAHWPSDVLAGISFGLLICMMVAIFYRHVSREHLRPILFAIGFAIVFMVAGVWHVKSTYRVQVTRYMPHTELNTLEVRQWWNQGWRDLPVNRIDLAGEHEEPFSLQWFGGAEALGKHLLDSGWRDPPAWSLNNVTGFLKPDTPIDALPATTALHDGLEALLLLVRDGAVPGERWLLRAWSSGFEATFGERHLPLLVVSVVKQSELHPGKMLSLPMVREPEFTMPALLDGLVGKIAANRNGQLVKLASEVGINEFNPGVK